MKSLNKHYFAKRDFFFYIKVSNKQLNRDNVISNILDEEELDEYFIGDGITKDIKYARFWKDENSAKKYSLSKKFKDYDIFEIKKLNRDEFINLIPDNYEINNHITIKNSKLKKEEVKYLKAWDFLRKRYKAISAYSKVDKPYMWYPCKNCGLIPLVWEFNNGRKTACGCGKNEYNHHSISAESIMSYVSRNNGSALEYNSDELRINWNHWVKTGEDLFKIQKEKNNKIW
jgi:hypothetical protein